MILYDFKSAPNALRVRMFLAEKGMTVDTRQVDIVVGENLGPEYREVNPSGLVPALRTEDGLVIAESIAICRYIEGLQPEPNLFGRTAEERAVIEMWERRMEREGLLSIAHAFREQTPIFDNRAAAGSSREVPQIAALAERGLALSQDFLAMLDARLAQCEFVAGGRFTVADITAFTCCGFAKWVGLDPVATGEGLARWYRTMKQRPSARA